MNALRVIPSISFVSFFNLFYCFPEMVTGRSSLGIHRYMRVNDKIIIVYVSLFSYQTDIYSGKVKQIKIRKRYMFGVVTSGVRRGTFSATT